MTGRLFFGRLSNVREKALSYVCFILFHDFHCDTIPKETIVHLIYHI
jgi:hypothetical protein